ncbi:Type III restriction-modification system methylation subunit [hydrothermal vent metagenome]|uniref:Type III restriction-modification system methylation subunit n=1 Tax=hydrothermal vent metagenome TaxID=652676 RepID=A0A1W1C4P2_9ZZZZ
MQLNSEDGGDRRYILVQLPEPIDPKKNKTAYEFVHNELKVENPTIFDITKERLLRAGEKIAENAQNVDIGFKIFETVPIWEDYGFEAEEFNPTLPMFDANSLSLEDLETLLITWKTYDGIDLAQDLESIDLDGYIGHYFDNKLYLIYKGFETKHLVRLIEEIDTNRAFSPSTIIAFGYNFESKTLRELAENLKNYANKKEIDIDFIVRY